MEAEGETEFPKEGSLLLSIVIFLPLLGVIAIALLRGLGASAIKGIGVIVIALLRGLGASA